MRIWPLVAVLVAFDSPAIFVHSVARRFHYDGPLPWMIGVRGPLDGIRGVLMTRFGAPVTVGTQRPGGITQKMDVGKLTQARKGRTISGFHGDTQRSADGDPSGPSCQTSRSLSRH
jgi:hypothetical protein